MKGNLMCFYFLIDEMRKLEKIIKELNNKIHKLQTDNFTQKRKIKDLEATLSRYKEIVSNGYI